MENEKNNQQKNKRSFVIIYILGFIIALFFELYWINYFPYDYFMLFGIGAIICFLGYLSIDGILEIVQDINRKKEEQNELLIKASKAIYLATKKNSADADKKQIQNLKALDAIINHAVENIHTTAPNNVNQENINALLDELSATNARLSDELENVRALVKENELSINHSPDILETASETEVEEMISEDVSMVENMVSATTVDSSVAEEMTDIDISNIEDFETEADIVMAEPLSLDMETETPLDTEADIVMTESVSLDIETETPLDTEVDIVMAEPLSLDIETEIPLDTEADIVMAESVSLDIEADAETISENVTEESVTNEIIESAMEDISIDIQADEIIENTMESISSDLSEEATIETSDTTETLDTVSDDIISQENETTETLSTEPVITSTSSPEKALSPEEIAALFANL